MIKAIIFDFDGVIVESVNIKSAAFAEMYFEQGNDVVEEIMAHHLANGGMSRFEKFTLYHMKYLGVHLTEKELADLSDRFSHLVVDKVIAAPYVRGAYEFLSEYHSFYDIYISTGTPETEIISILKAKKLLGFFKGIYGSPRKKGDHVRNILSKGNYQINEIIFVGDSLSDRDAANKNNIPFIARIAEGNGQLESEAMIIPDLNDFCNKIKEFRFYN